jgi:hypothetical protein
VGYVFNKAPRCRLSCRSVDSKDTEETVERILCLYPYLKFTAGNALAVPLVRVITGARKSLSDKLTGFFAEGSKRSLCDTLIRIAIDFRSSFDQAMPAEPALHPLCAIRPSAWAHGA